MDEPKIGAGMAQAAWRQGLKELGTALSKPLPDSIQVDEVGTIANLTPQEVYATKQPEVKEPEPEM